MVFEPGTVLIPVGEGGERVNTGALVGEVCVGVVVLLVAVILVVFIIRKWKQRHRKRYASGFHLGISSWGGGEAHGSRGRKAMARGG